MSSQPCFPDLFYPATTPKVHKAQRQTAREVYRYQRARDKALEAQGRETKQGMVLRCLAAYWNRRQRTLTAQELLRWMLSTGENVRDVNDVRPKLHYLWKKGIVEPATPRKCRVTSERVHTWRVREIGSQESR